MSNAAKYKKKAAELELQKQFDKAVASYARAIEIADADGEEIEVALLNKVGDLNLRLGRVADAVASYERAVDHYAQHALYNNAIALCNKILRHAPGRSGIYLSLGRICGKKGMRGDATRNLLEYARRMKEEGRTDEAMRSLAEVAALMPELEEIRAFVAEHAERSGISLPSAPAEVAAESGSSGSAAGLVFLDIDYDAPVSTTPALGTPPIAPPVAPAAPPVASPAAPAAKTPRTSSLDDLLIFDPLADDVLEPEPVALDGLDTLPESVLDADVPSLLAPAEPVDAEPTLALADGLTDALGFEAEQRAELDAEPLHGLVADEPDAEPLDGLVADELDAEPLDGLVADEPDAEPLVGLVADEPDADVDFPPVYLDTLTPYRGVEAITPPSLDPVTPVELEALSPFESLDAITPSSLESVTPIELDALTPFDGIDALTPSSLESVPPIELDALTPFDGIDAITPPSLESVPPIELGALTPFAGLDVIPPDEPAVDADWFIELDEVTPEMQASATDGVSEALDASAEIDRAIDGLDLEYGDWPQDDAPALDPEEHVHVPVLDADEYVLTPALDESVQTDVPVLAASELVDTPVVDDAVLADVPVVDDAVLAARRRRRCAPGHARARRRRGDACVRDHRRPGAGRRACARARRHRGPAGQHAVATGAFHAPRAFDSAPRSARFHPAGRTAAHRAARSLGWHRGALGRDRGAAAGGSRDGRVARAGRGRRGDRRCRPRGDRAG
jgi:hypothetical protein